MTICSVWNRLRFALAASAVLLLVGCNAGTPAPTAAPSPFPDAQPGSDWIPAVAQGWPDQPGFSLMLPPGWALNELQGIDSYVGEITGDGVRLMFDYGRYGWNLTPEDEPEHEYIVSFEDIGGREAKLLLAVDSPSNSTTATYEAATGVHFGGLDSNHNLMLEGRGLTREQQRVAIAIFRSIRLPE